MHQKVFTDYGSGGMITKIEAAKICMASGCRMILTKRVCNNPLSKLRKKNSALYLFQIQIDIMQKNGYVAASKTKDQLLLMMELKMH